MGPNEMSKCPAQSFRPGEEAELFTYYNNRNLWQYLFVERHPPLISRHFRVFAFLFIFIFFCFLSFLFLREHDFKQSREGWTL